MERFLISELEKWKHKKNRKPMVLMGARQVGKTWLMKTFGERNYKKVAYISFYNNQAMKNIFESDYDIKRILPYLNIEVTKYDNIDKNGLVKTEVSYYKKLDYLIVRIYQPNYTPYDAGIFENFYYITLQNWLRSRSESDKYYYYSTQRRTTWFNKTVNDKPCIVMDVQVILYKD